MNATLETPNIEMTETAATSTHLTSQDKNSGRAEIVLKAIEFVESRGVSPEDSMKLIGLLNGGHCPLRSLSLHIADVNAVADEAGFFIDPIGGFLNTTLAGSPVTIVPRPDAAQRLFLISQERVAQPTRGLKKAEWFDAFTLICLETNGSAPLALGLDANMAGEAVHFDLAWRMYQRTRTNPDGTKTQTSELKNLTGLANLKEVLAHVAVICDFPLERVRPFPTRANTSTRAGSFRQPEAPAVPPAPEVEFVDPFAES